MLHALNTVLMASNDSGYMYCSAVIAACTVYCSDGNSVLHARNTVLMASNEGLKEIVRAVFLPAG